MHLTIAMLQLAHAARQEEWCPDQKPDLSFRGNEMAGEVGEACNVIKKLERERQGWRGSRATREELADELADVVHTAVLTAITAGIDLQPAVTTKFNKTSEKNGLRTFLDGPFSCNEMDISIGDVVCPWSLADTPGERYTVAGFAWTKGRKTEGWSVVVVTEDGEACYRDSELFSFGKAG